MYLYEIRNKINSKVYTGIARKSVVSRWNSHKWAHSRYKTPLYDAMKVLGFDKFYLEVVCSFNTEQELLDAEKEQVAYYKHLNLSYNVLDGGESYFPIVDKEAWKKKLSDARQGRTPALGMKHTEENKKRFSMFGKKRWDLYGRYPDYITHMSFSEASKKYGISKTHYYRLRKRNTSNESV